MNVLDIAIVTIELCLRATVHDTSFFISLPQPLRPLPSKLKGRKWRGAALRLLRFCDEEVYVMRGFIWLAACLTRLVCGFDNTTAPSSGYLPSGLHTSSASTSTYFETTSSDRIRHGTKTGALKPWTTSIPSYEAPNGTATNCTHPNKFGVCWGVVTFVPNIKVTRTELLPDASTIIPMDADTSAAQTLQTSDPDLLHISPSTWLLLSPDLKSTQTELLVGETIIPIASGHDESMYGDPSTGGGRPESTPDVAKIKASLVASATPDVGRSTVRDHAFATADSGASRTGIALQVMTTAGSSVSEGVFDGVVIDSQTLLPGSSAIAFEGSTYSLSPAGSGLVVNGILQPLQVAGISSTGEKAGAYFPVNGNTITEGPSGVVIAGQTIAPGSQLSVSSTTYSLASDQAVLYVNGRPVSQQYAAHNPRLTLGSNIYTEDTNISGFVIGSQTLTLGETLTIGSGSEVETLRMSVGAWGATEVLIGTTSTVILSDPSRATLGASISSSGIASVAPGETEDGDSPLPNCAHAVLYSKPAAGLLLAPDATTKLEARICDKSDADTTWFSGQAQYPFRIQTLTNAMARDHGGDRVAKAHSIFVRLVLPPYTIHFKSPTYMRDGTLELLDKKVCKETLKSTAQDARVRAAIGGDGKFWAEMVVLFKAAIPSLERRSFTIWDPSSVDYESTSGALIASHYPVLWKDLERLNDLVSISRNVLTIGGTAQDLAAEHGIDIEVFRLINCCVRVTARGYDGEAGTGDEEKWQWIVNAYKKLLITSLQFLNNLVAQNERQKLMLWVALFDHTAATNRDPVLDVSDELVEAKQSMKSNSGAVNLSMRPRPPIDEYDILISYGTNGSESLVLDGAEPLWDDEPFSKWPLPPEVLEGRATMQGNGYVYFHVFNKQDQFEDYQSELGRDPTEAEQHLEMPRRWGELSEVDRHEWQKQYEAEETKYKQNLAVYEAKLLLSQPVENIQQAEKELSELPVAQQAKAVEKKIAALEESLAERYRTESTSKTNGSVTPAWANVAPLEPPTYGPDGHPIFPTTDPSTLNQRAVTQDDMTMLFTAGAGSKILESGKAELMKRLEGYEAPPLVDGSSSERRNTLHSNVSNQTLATAGRTRSLSLTGDVSHPQSLFRRRSSVQNSQHRSRAAAVDDNSLFQDSQDDEDEDEGLGDEGVDESEDGEEDDEDYPGSTEDGRGLLTDVPLILGPSEIEVLPMLIMSGIVPPANLNTSTMSDEERNALTNMHTVRTHLLLSQSNGRNLLRELLIFVAAWDLREEELYFKFMVKIMEAILKNGLMPYAYHAFRDRSRSKDIISPAQAVIMKLMTCIFRARGEAQKSAAAGATTSDDKEGSRTAAPTNSGVHDKHSSPSEAQTHKTKQPDQSQPTTDYAMPSRVDLHILNFIFTEFRQHIIPQTCALIFLQGQIHVGRASPEDFPLNLWDMERMYEGVYQYLEFFAVLSEEVVWKGILGGWEMASELVTLLRELEGGIPKMNSGGQPHRMQAPLRRVSHQVVPGSTAHVPQRSMSADSAIPYGHASLGQHYAVSPLPPQPDQQQQAPGLVPVAVERPFDVETPSGVRPDVANTPRRQDLVTGQPIFEAETPLAYPEDPIAPLSEHDLHHGPSASVAAAGLTADQDEPSDFEWRNLKKLTVLVLSSLIWKNKTVQEQVRRYGGLEALVGCCRTDEHNPYIREHAIMCLRFAVEGCEENAKVIRAMAESGQAVHLQQHAQQQQQAQRERQQLQVQQRQRQQQLEALDAGDLSPPFGEFDVPKEPSGAQTPELVGSSATAGSSSTPVKNIPRMTTSRATAEKAVELMQNVVRDLPLGGKLVTDQQKREAMAKLDRAFDSTEKALARSDAESFAGNVKGRGNGSAKELRYKAIFTCSQTTGFLAMLTFFDVITDDSWLDANRYMQGNFNGRQLKHDESANVLIHVVK
nr:copper transport protein 86 [Quercus suber]